MRAAERLRSRVGYALEYCVYWLRLPNETP
jgi:hypothetical protein